jgi:nucleotidyltransferase/DNA polymerase involved in DNA repair
MRRRAADPAIAVGEHHDGSFGTYMLHKRAKLAEGFEERFGADGSALFARVAVWIDGFTSPSAEELKAILGAGGGRVMHYLSLTDVTHIVAQALPDSKVKEIEAKRLNAQMAVVFPSWIVDSAKAGRLLPVADYLLPQFKASSAGIAGFLAPPPAAASGGPRSASDPEFMAGYFNSSRLSFIGGFRAKAQKLVAQGGSRGAGSGGARVIAHVDVDCFFAAVALLDKPHLANVPVAVAHAGGRASGSAAMRSFGDSPVGAGATAGAPSPSRPQGGGSESAALSSSVFVAAVHAKSTAEISSCNYPARALGIRAGQSVGSALERCPTLVVLPYNFDRIASASEAVYRAFMEVTDCVQAVSCDEAFLDLTGLPQPATVMSALRAKIYATTGVTVSAGIGPNMLLAKIATGKAKPNGQLVVSDAAGAAFLAPLSVRELPGVGYSTGGRLEDEGIKTIAELVSVPSAKLEAWFGAKAGAKLFAAARGEDDRVVTPIKARKSVGAEVNWGIRFTTMQQAHAFLVQLGAEVARRLQVAGEEDAAAFGVPALDEAGAPVRAQPLRARALTLKVMVRQSDAPMARKFLGHGVCDACSRTVPLRMATADGGEIAAAASAVLTSLGVAAADLRGVGIQLTKLVRPDGRPVVDAAEDNPPASRTLLQYMLSKPPVKKEADMQGAGAGAGLCQDVIEIEDGEPEGSGAAGEVDRSWEEESTVDAKYLSPTRGGAIRFAGSPAVAKGDSDVEEVDGRPAGRGNPGLLARTGVRQMQLNFPISPRLHARERARASSSPGRVKEGLALRDSGRPAAVAPVMEAVGEGALHLLRVPRLSDGSPCPRHLTDALRAWVVASGTRPPADEAAELLSTLAALVRDLNREDAIAIATALAAVVSSEEHCGEEWLALVKSARDASFARPPEPAPGHR